MESIKELYKTIENSSLSVLSARPGCFMPTLLSQLIIEYGLNANKKVTIFMQENTSWLTSHILSTLLEKPHNEVLPYLLPLTFYKSNRKPIDHEKLCQNIEKLYKSSIDIEDLTTYRKEYIDTIVKNIEEADEKPDFIIIYGFENLFRDATYSPREILKKIEHLVKMNIKIILIAKMERSVEDSTVQNFEDIHNYNELKMFANFFLIIETAIERENENAKIKIKTTAGDFTATYDYQKSTLE